MTAYYNEHDAYAAQWLRNLIDAGHIAPGIVDERDIRDVKPEELKGYTQCHFFAGIGVWSLALRRAGWPDDKPVWTGSCPCQPFSAAGRRGGTSDERHLWPHWFHLITQCEPGRIFGEQVASKDGLDWLDLVQTDLEGADYAHGAVDLCAAGVGAPHIRQRLWFIAERLADSDPERRSRISGSCGTQSERIAELHETSQLADTSSDRRVGKRQSAEIKERRETRPDERGKLPARSERYRILDAREPAGLQIGQAALAAPTNGLWRDVDWLFCRDGKWRPVEPGTFPLVDGAPSRVGRLRAYGNAINAQAAQTFIESYLGDRL